MRHPISRRIVAAAILALAAWASAPRSLRAVPASGFGIVASQDADLFAPVRRWMSAIWPWHSSGASRSTVRNPTVARPQNGCGIDPNGGQQCTNVVKPQNGCGIDPSGQQCNNVLKPQNGCGADPNGQPCSNVVKPQNGCGIDPDGQHCSHS